MQPFHAFLDLHMTERPDAPALREQGGAEWSFRDLQSAAKDLGAHLTGVGVQAGDRVVLIVENCCAAVAGLFACSQIGAWAVPINARMTASEIDRILDHARPAAVLSTTQISPDAAAHSARHNGVEITGAFGTLGVAQPYPSTPEPDHDVAVMLYTTGTTGQPKGVMLTHANLRFGGKTSADLRGMRAGDLVYGALPITHIFGLASMVMAASYKGATVLLEPRFTAAKLYQALHDGVTLLPAVPQMHALLMQYVKEQGHETLGMDNLRYVSSGGAPLDPAWKAKAEAFYGVALQNGYGMTETTAGISVTQSEIGDPDISTGPALPDVEVRIDETVAGGGDGIGEVLTRGPHIMKGYYRNPNETAKVLDADGWLHTGDMGKFDAQTHLHIVGRSKELIIHGGFNVYPPEVEAALNDHPQVVQAAVVGRMKDGDEQVMAFVQVADDDRPDLDDLRAFAAKRLAGYKRPSQIILGTDLPAAPTGKILKHKLLEAFADQLD